jgi:hypothetical protein
MFNRDFVEELVAQLIYGITDKKKTVDKIYNEDITKDQIHELKNGFLSIVEKLSLLDSIHPMAKSRFSQKNDFYTIFGLVNELEDLSQEELCHIYRMLLGVSSGIRPSNDSCLILQEYAVNCVMQSNSKKARERRLQILLSLICNETRKANKYQKEIMNYYKFVNDQLLTIGKYSIIDHSRII